ncbi:MFS transporter [Scytonema sp. NUACC26]|uniref:MFS transporter n=1 Tax=Scytonema sp. NUACC26 TaxID=3140176 RepID=UPI0038B30C00
MSQPINSPLVKMTLLFVSTLAVMASATIAPSLPIMREHFADVDNVDYWVRLVLTAPSLFVAIGAPFAGFMIDSIGRKTLLAITLIMYGLAGSSGLWLNSIGLILVGRALLGLSVAGIMTTATTLIADYYTGTTRAKFLGLQAAFMALGGVVFLSGGGFLAEVNWRMPFLLYSVALLLLPLVLLILPEPRRNSQSSGQQSSSQTQAVSFPFALVVLTYTIAFLAQVVFYMVPVQLPFYLQALTNASASQSGLAIALATLFAAIGSILYQRIKARLSFMSVYEIAFFGIGVGYGLICFANGYGMVLPGLAIAGFGLGLLLPNMNLCLTSIAPDTLRGRTLGGLTTCFFLGQFISPLLSQPLSQLVGLRVAYGLAGILVIVLALVTFVVMSRQKRLA